MKAMEGLVSGGARLPALDEDGMEALERERPGLDSGRLGRWAVETEDWASTENKEGGRGDWIGRRS